MLDGYKWDPQVGDSATLAPFPLLLARDVWRELAQAAELLAAETMMLESAVLARPDLLAELGLPAPVRRALLLPTPLSPAVGRVMRFDFHPTDAGWRLSEVNGDVPGGYPEASYFTRLMAEHCSAGEPSGDPARALVEVFSRCAGPGELIVLLSAPGYMEDLQVVSYLARCLRDRGRLTALAHPAQLTWTKGRATLETRAVAALLRFHQAEWLAGLPANSGWANFFRGGLTPGANPGVAVISESKRLPVLWDRLRLELPAWRRWLPETRDPREAPWFRDDGWLLKAAYSNTGEAVVHRSFRSAAHWRQISFAALCQPRRWVAQRRFNSRPLDTPLGSRHACVGIYTVDGRAAGAYARLAARPLIAFDAMDAAVLITHAH